MNTTRALFPCLLGHAAWHGLPEPVRCMHGSAASVLARGTADVQGDDSLLLRAFRRLLGLPPPGMGQALEVCIERRDGCETWTRRFALGQMRSTLRCDASAAHLLERLGPVLLRFKLNPDARGVAWHMNGAWILGIPIPHRWLGTVQSHSGEHDGRYAFAVDTRLPWLGRLVAYRGWLEIAADD